MSIEEDTAYFKYMLDLIPPQIFGDSAKRGQLITQPDELAQLEETKHTQESKRKRKREQDNTEKSEEKKKSKRKQKNKEKKKGDNGKNPLHTQPVTKLEQKKSDPSQFTEIKTKKVEIESEMKGVNPLAAVGLDLDDKRSKLRAKIEELQAKKKLNDFEKAQKGQLERTENKMKPHEKRNVYKQGKQHFSADSSTMCNGSDKIPDSKLSTPTKPVVNKEGQRVFSKFDFTDSNKKVKVTEMNSKRVELEPVTKRGNPLTTVTLDLDDKRARLRAKIEELQAKRKLNDNEKAQRRQLKRKERKLKLKEARKALKQGKHSNANTSVNGSDKTHCSKFSTPSKPIVNKEGQMVFSKFDFTDSNKKEKRKNEFKGKDYKRLLEKVEKRNEKINKLKSKDEAAGKILQDKYKWKAAFDKAVGEKVKDNPELLKKALKRKEKIKIKTKKKWQDRENTVKKQQTAKQEKRNKNLQARKQAKKDKKIKKAIKKGRIIPGF